MSFHQFLDNVTVGELVNGKPNIVQVLSTDTVERCLDVFKQHKVLALPVGSVQRGEYIGIIDLLDIMIFVAFSSVQNLLLLTLVSTSKVEENCRYRNKTLSDLPT